MINMAYARKDAINTKVVRIVLMGCGYFATGSTMAVRSEINAAIYKDGCIYRIRTKDGSRSIMNGDYVEITEDGYEVHRMKEFERRYSYVKIV